MAGGGSPFAFYISMLNDGCSLLYSNESPTKCIDAIRCSTAKSEARKHIDKAVRKNKNYIVS
jgi:hypothetical protein